MFYNVLHYYLCTHFEISFWFVILITTALQCHKKKVLDSFQIVKPWQKIIMLLFTAWLLIVFKLITQLVMSHMSHGWNQRVTSPSNVLCMTFAISEVGMLMRLYYTYSLMDCIVVCCWVELPLCFTSCCLEGVRGTLHINSTFRTTITTITWPVTDVNWTRLCTSV